MKCKCHFTPSLVLLIRQRKSIAIANAGFASHYPEPLQSFTGSSHESNGNSVLTMGICWVAIPFPLRFNSAAWKSKWEANRRQFPQLQQLVKCLQEYVLFRNKSNQRKVNKGFNFTHTKNSMHNLKGNQNKKKLKRILRNNSAKTQIKCRSIQNNTKNKNQKSLWTQRNITSQIMWPKLPANLAVAQLCQV